MRYYGIDYKRQSSCKNRPEKCVMSEGAYLTSKYQYKINECNKKKASYIFML